LRFRLVVGQYGALSAVDRNLFHGYYRNRAIVYLVLRYPNATRTSVAFTPRVVRARRAIEDELFVDMEVGFAAETEMTEAFTEALSNTGTEALKVVVSSAANEAIVDGQLSASLTNTTTADILSSTASFDNGRSSSSKEDWRDYKFYYIGAAAGLVLLAVVIAGFTKCKSRSEGSRRNGTVSPMQVIDGPRRMMASHGRASREGTSPFATPSRVVKVMPSGNAAPHPFRHSQNNQREEAHVERAVPLRS
jgi:hypothetical protein